MSTDPTIDPAPSASRVEAIRQREQAATKGPWRDGVDGNNRIYGPDNAYDDSGLLAVVYKGRETQTFIAHAREDIPYLLAALHAAEARIAEVEQRAREITILAQEMYPLVSAHAYEIHAAGRSSDGDPFDECQTGLCAKVKQWKQVLASSHSGEGSNSKSTKI